MRMFADDGRTTASHLAQDVLEGDDVLNVSLLVTKLNKLAARSATFFHLPNNQCSDEAPGFHLGLMEIARFETLLVRCLRSAVANVHEVPWHL